MKRLTWLIANCHTVHIEANDHRSSYRTVAQEVADDLLLRKGQQMFECVEAHVIAECVKRNEIIELMIYPHTPIGSVVWYHYDFEALMARAWAWAVAEHGAPTDLVEASP